MRRIDRCRVGAIYAWFFIRLVVVASPAVSPSGADSWDTIR